ncbi:MAG: exosortase C-terminal domain/associated protein EpsI [Candidatus Hodarchaeales archaeon]|jgi:EpsI family protein
MNSKKYFIIIILLILAILISYSLPKTKYTGTGFISKLRIPESMSDWIGKDVTKEVGLTLNSRTYDFVSEAVAYNFVNNEGENLLFIILDAANFHHPKVCFTGAGFKIKELADTEFHLPNYTLKTHTLFTERGRDNFLSFYWIVIDKNVAHEWIEQKFKQLFFSLFGKKRVGLMVRIDIPAKEDNIEETTILAKKFISEMSQSILKEQADFIFGINN